MVKRYNNVCVKNSVEKIHITALSDRRWNLSEEVIVFLINLTLYICSIYITPSKNLNSCLFTKA